MNTITLTTRQIEALLCAKDQWVVLRILKLCTVNPSTDCWEIDKNLNRDGYPRLSIKGSTKYAHREMYIAYCGQIDDGLVVCHKCDNPKCVNPFHLFAGTMKDNMQDALAKGRLSATTTSGSYKITEEQAEEIVSLHASGIKQSEICKRFGISRYTVFDIVSGRRWKGIKRK